jgi:hypothetical protein
MQFSKGARDVGGVLQSQRQRQWAGGKPFRQSLFAITAFPKVVNGMLPHGLKSIRLQSPQLKPAVAQDERRDRSGVSPLWY